MTALKRDEILEKCKQHACAYLDKGELRSAATSMASDLQKYPELRGPDILYLATMAAADRGDAEAVRRYIVGFN